MLKEYLWAALGSAAVAIAVSSVFVLVVMSFLPFRVADVVVAFAPGAQDTMNGAALFSLSRPCFVGAHHLTRFLVVTFSVALTARKMGTVTIQTGDTCDFGAPRRAHEVVNVAAATRPPCAVLEAAG